MIIVSVNPTTIVVKKMRRIVGKRIGEDARWIEWRDAGVDIGRGGGGGDKKGGKRIMTEAADVQNTGVIKKENIKNI